MPCKSSSPAGPGLLGTKPDLRRKAKCVYVCVCVLKKIDITVLIGLSPGGTVTVVINLLFYTHSHFL